jgi:hypothetical protein
MSIYDGMGSRASCRLYTSVGGRDAIRLFEVNKPRIREAARPDRGTTPRTSDKLNQQSRAWVVLSNAVAAESSIALCKVDIAVYAMAERASILEVSVWRL